MKVSEILSESTIQSNDVLNEGPVWDTTKKIAKGIGNGIAGASALAGAVPGAFVGGAVRGYQQARTGKSYKPTDEKPVSKKRRYDIPVDDIEADDNKVPPMSASKPAAKDKSTAKPSATKSVIFTDVLRQVKTMSPQEQRKLFSFLQKIVTPKAAKPKAAPSAEQPQQAQPQQATPSQAPKKPTAAKTAKVVSKGAKTSKKTAAI